MIITRLTGGLGNQMFQYALGRALALKNDTDLKLDITGFETYTLHAYSLAPYALKADIATQQEIDTVRGGLGLPGRIKRFANARKPLAKRWYVIERQFRFDPEILTLGENVYLDGYWQSDKYFNDHAEAIRSELRVKTAPEGVNAELMDAVNAGNSVSLHVRRGDYVSDAETNSVHGCCSMDYYDAAVAYMRKEAGEDIRLFIFSDDPDWAREHLRFSVPTTVVDANGPERNYEDLRLMSTCRHNIVANSTFSWWGAWLNANPEKLVVAPRQWFKAGDRDNADLIPAAWKRL